MKYCSKCGAQMNDEAVLCVACGCMIESALSKSATRPARVSSPKAKSGEGNSSFRAFSFVHSVLSMLALYFVAISMILAEAYTYRGVVTILPNSACIIASLGFGVLSLALAIVCLIVGAKRTQVRESLSGILRIIASVLLTLTAILGVAVILLY